MIFLISVGLVLSGCNKLDLIDCSDDKIWLIGPAGLAYQQAAGEKRIYEVRGESVYISSKGKIKLKPGQCFQYVDSSLHRFVIWQLIKQDQRLDNPENRAEADKQLAILKKEGVL